MMKSKKAKSEKTVVAKPDAGAAAKAMSKELLLVVDAVANEKGVDKNVIFDAMEAALASAAKKRYPRRRRCAGQHRQAQR